MRNTGKPSEKILDEAWTIWGKHANVFTFVDSAKASGLNKRKTNTGAQPSDRLLTLKQPADWHEAVVARVADGRPRKRPPAQVRSRSFAPAWKTPEALSVSSQAACETPAVLIRPGLAPAFLRGIRGTDQMPKRRGLRPMCAPRRHSAQRLSAKRLIYMVRPGSSAG